MRIHVLFLSVLSVFFSSLPSLFLEALPAQIIIIRNAETNSNSHSNKKYRNETEKKTSNSDELSLKGKERAAALVPYLLQTHEFTTFSTPAAIYAAALPQPATSQYTQDTVRPIADFLKIGIKDTFEPKDYKKMVEEIKKDTSLSGKTVLICWDYLLIPELARAFGALQTPATWPTNAFDRTWIITLQPSRKASFQNLPQRLMYGDSST